MRKQDIFDAFKGQISKIAIVNRDGEFVLQGKFCVVSPIEDRWDIWLCKPKDIAAGLSARKLQSLIRRLDLASLEGGFTELDGEAWFRVFSTDFVLQNLPVLGIRRKKRANLGTVVAMNAAREAA